MNRIKNILNYNIGKPIINFLLTIIFIASHIIFSCSSFVMDFLLLVANSNAMKNYDNFIDIAFGCIELTIFYILIYLFIKISLFVLIYEGAMFNDKSSRISQFLYSFINSSRFRLKIILLAIGMDIIMSLIQFMCNGEYVSLTLLKQCGGVTISYLAFALYKK